MLMPGATVNGNGIFGLHDMERWSMAVDRNNTTVIVWLDVLVSGLDVSPDLMLADILSCFEIQHLFDTRDRRYTQRVTEP